MSNITLPEITIEGHPNSNPQNAADWYCEGFMFGWNNPGITPEAPAPLREDLLSAYFEGVAASQATRAEIESTFDGPAIGPDLGGESFEELERQWKEAWSEFLNHREEPHIEPPGIEFMP